MCFLKENAENCISSIGDFMTIDKTCMMVSGTYQSSAQISGSQERWLVSMDDNCNTSWLQGLGFAWPVVILPRGSSWYLWTCNFPTAENVLVFLLLTLLSRGPGAQLGSSSELPFPIVSQKPNKWPRGGEGLQEWASEGHLGRCSKLDWGLASTVPFRQHQALVRAPPPYLFLNPENLKLQKEDKTSRGGRQCKRKRFWT